MAQDSFPELNWDQYFPFPPVEQADEDGFLASGGNLSPGMILSAYRQGIFPWYNPEEEPLWWSPDPRFVLYPSKLHISSSMKKFLKKNPFRVTLDQAFGQVMEACRSIRRPKQRGTWIGDEIVDGYTQLHQLGFAHSVEVWQDTTLVGGLYGIQLGRIFFGESMFSKVDNASKTGFLTLVPFLVQYHRVELIDCQVRTEHLVSLGAQAISRTQFLSHLDLWVDFPGNPAPWNTNLLFS